MRFICWFITGFFILLYTSTFASASSAGGKVRYLRYAGRKYVYLRDVAAYYGMKCTIGKKRALLYSKYSRIGFTYDKNSGYLNGVKVHYFHPPFLRGNDAFISENDFLKYIDPILRSYALPTHKVGTILLDPGHGGKDDGGKGRYYKEKDIVFRIALKTKYYLEKKGYKVILTRSTDKLIPLEQRPVQAKADLLVSIHTNIAGTESVSGIETFALPPTGVSSTHGSNHNGWEPGNKFDRNNTRLGYEIQKSLIKATGGPDRGLKCARFMVLKKAVCPAILVETGFLSNHAEELKLGNNAWQNKIAQAIADGIYHYHKAMYSK